MAPFAITTQNSFLLTAGLFLCFTTTAADIEPKKQFFLPNNPHMPPEEADQRSPCPFVNTMANHGFVPRNGVGADLVQMILDMEEIFSVSSEFLFGIGNFTVDCGQTYMDENGVIRFDLDRLFDPNCEEHEASLVRQDNFFGFEESKSVDDTLLNNLMKMNPSSNDLTIEEVFEYQTIRILDSIANNPAATVSEDDITAAASQAIALMMLGDDPQLRTVPKERVYTVLLFERIPDSHIPGGIRDTPYNVLDPNDPVSQIFNVFADNIRQLTGLKR